MEKIEMKLKYLVPVVAIIIGILPAFVAAQNSVIKSVYTDLSKNCRTVEDGGLDFVKRCHGPAGYDLLAGLYDERFDVTVISPAKKKFEQGYSPSISQSSFSDPGGKAEWRVRQSGGKMVPFALIVRVMVQEDSAIPKETSYMAVSKITGRSVCVTDKIAPGPNQNERARAAADSSETKPCLAN